MTHRRTVLARRFTLVVALATVMATPLPAASAGKAVGKGRRDGGGNGASCPGAVDPSRSAQPGVPFVIDVHVFLGGKKGLLGASEILLSTKLANTAWTSFFDRLSARVVGGYVAAPASIPTIQVGDVIQVSAGRSTLGYRALAAGLEPGATVVVPVVVPGARGTATVAGFATLAVTRINVRGKAKYVHATLLALDLAPCFARS